MDCPEQNFPQVLVKERVQGLKYRLQSGEKRKIRKIVFAKPVVIDLNRLDSKSNKQVPDTNTEPSVTKVINQPIDVGTQTLGTVRGNIRKKRRKRRSHHPVNFGVSPNAVSQPVVELSSTSSGSTGNPSPSELRQLLQTGTATQEIFINKVNQQESSQVIVPKDPLLPSQISEESDERVKLTPAREPEVIQLSSDASSSVESRSSSCLKNGSKSINKNGSPGSPTTKATSPNHQDRSRSPQSSLVFGSISSNDQNVGSVDSKVEESSFRPVITSTCVNQQESVSDQGKLTAVGKKCLETIPIIFYQYFGIPMDTCLQVLARNEFNILTTIVELQDLAHEQDESSDE